MSQHLFLFTISPVQTFIAQARKTQDLYAGSRILSELIGYAMKEAQNETHKTEFIFPTNINAKSKPNRFTAIINPKLAIQSFGNLIQEKVQIYFVETLGKEVLALYPDSKIQLKDFLKIYWVAIPFDDKADYATQLRQAEKYLGATKNVRYFNQLEVAEVGRKCSLNGEYNVQFYRLSEGEKENDRLYDKKLFNRKLRVFNSEKDYKILPQSHLQQGEGLCAISMLKRLFEVEKPFPSVSEIALQDTLDKAYCLNDIQNNSFKECAEFMNIIDNNDRKEYQLFYEENHIDKNLKEVGIITQPSKENFRNKYNSLVSKLKKSNLVLSKYYAILVFDADGMGSKLSKCRSKDEHQKISGLLAEFGKKATEYIDTNRFGRTVYAGGDDFLGFINLNHLFKIMEGLRKIFDTDVNANLTGEYEHLRLTFSAGVAIAHYKTPLGEVLDWARKMEKKAKKVESLGEKNQKDSFAIAVLKHSGEIHDTIWRWKDENCHWTTKVIENLTHYLRDKDISDAFITNLSVEFLKILSKNGDWGENNTETKELNAIFKSELKRFAKRAKSDNSSITNIDTFCNELYHLYEYHYNTFGLNLQNFLNLLHICEFISRHLNKTQKS